MGYQDSGEVLMRGRKIENTTALQAEKTVETPGSGSGAGNFTAHNSEFDRRRAELRKVMARDRAAAESELARLSKRCDVLKEFLIESDSAAGDLEHISAITNAEKEFASRMEQLEIRYFRAFGKYSDIPAQKSAVLNGDAESAPGVRTPADGKSFLLLAAAIVLAALIVALSQALIFL